MHNNRNEKRHTGRSFRRVYSTGLIAKHRIFNRILTHCDICDIIVPKWGQKTRCSINFAACMIFVDYIIPLEYIPGQNHIAAKNEKHLEKCIFF